MSNYKQKAKSYKEENKYLKDVIKAYQLAMSLIEGKIEEAELIREDHEKMVEAIDDAKDILYENVEISTELRNRSRAELFKLTAIPDPFSN